MLIVSLLISERREREGRDAYMDRLRIHDEYYKSYSDYYCDD